jgi:hypothetical protein
MAYAEPRYTRPKVLSHQTFNQLIAEDLENKRPYAAKFDTYCPKCGHDILKGQGFYYYGKGQKICIGCHEEAIDWCKHTFF